MLLLRGFDVDEHVGDARVSLLNGAFHLVRNVVAFAHGNVAVHADVKIDIKTQAHFSDETFFDFDDTGHGRGRISDKIDNFSARRGVHDFVKRGFQQADSHSRRLVRRRKAPPNRPRFASFAADQRDGNANEGGDGSHGIGAMMPGVGLHRGAFDIATNSNDIAKQSFFHHHHDDKDQRA